MGRNRVHYPTGIGLDVLGVLCMAGGVVESVTQLSGKPLVVGVLAGLGLIAAGHIARILGRILKALHEMQESKAKNL